MNKEEILLTIKSLAKSQGFYSRIYNCILDNEKALDYLAEQDFKDEIDLILFLEE